MVRTKVLLLCSVFHCGVWEASADSLQFLYTEFTPGTPFPEFITNGLVNEQQVSYYDSNKSTMIPRMDCVKMTRDEDPVSWNKETDRMQRVDKAVLKPILNDAMKKRNHTQGVHTMQWLYSCEQNNGSITTVVDHYAYDGEDFIIHDLKTLHQTSADDEAVITENNWDAGVGYPYIYKNYLKKECIKWLKKFISHCNETLERKVPPEALMFRKFSCSPELVCHATGFFPKKINMTWQKDGEDLIEDVALRETLPNQDGSFQKRSILKVSPEDLQKHEYTCVIKHSSLKEDLVLKARERRILRDDPWTCWYRCIIGCSTAVGCVFVVCIVGFLCWKCQAVPSSNAVNSHTRLLPSEPATAASGTKSVHSSNGDTTHQRNFQAEAQNMLEEESGPL